MSIYLLIKNKHHLTSHIQYQFDGVSINSKTRKLEPPSYVENKELVSQFIYVLYLIYILCVSMCAYVCACVCVDIDNKYYCKNIYF